MSLDAARAAREEAARLRLESVALRLSVRRSVQLAHDRTEEAAAAARTARYTRRAVPSASPWSGLEWCREDEELGRVLVPVD